MRTVLPGVEWVDVTQAGEVVWCGDNAPPPESLLFVRGDATATGMVGLIGQGHDSGTAWWWTTRGWMDLGPTFGAYPCEVEGVAGGWICYVMRAADRYTRITIDETTGHIISAVDTGISPTSQGFMDVTQPRLALTDAAFRIGDVVRPNACGQSYLVGQYYADPPRMVLSDRYGTVLRTLAEGICHEPHAAFVNGRIVACSRSTAAGAIVVEGRPEDFPLFVPVPEPPTPEPPMAMLETLKRLRAQYGPTCNDDQCVAICNDAAWEHRSEGYGVSRKEQGTRGTRYDGQDCCHDVIMLRDGTYWDCLNAAGGASVPTWSANPNGVITDPARGWVAPIVPQGNVDPPVPPDPPVSDLDARVAKIEDWLRSLGRVTTTGWPW